jgi:hypothetical protein
VVFATAVGIEEEDGSIKSMEQIKAMEIYRTLSRKEYPVVLPNE